MDDTRILGAANRFAGSVEEAAGSIIGDKATELSGKARALGGKGQQIYGEAVDAVRGATAGQPLTSLVAAGAFGLLFGFFLAKR